MNKIIKGTIAIMLCMCMLVPVEVSAKTLSEQDKEILYENYIYGTIDKLGDIDEFRMFDINGDGTEEMLCTYLAKGNRSRADAVVCTIKNGKVVKLKTFKNGISLYRLPGQKRLVVCEDHGGADIALHVYKMEKGALKKVTTYKSTYDSNYNTSYKKDSKKISEKAFFNFFNKLEWMIG